MSLTAEQEPKHTPTSPIDGGNTFGAALPLRARGEETALYHKRPSQNYPRPSGTTSFFSFHCSNLVTILT